MFDKNILYWFIGYMSINYIALIFSVLCVFLYLSDFVPDFILD